MKTKILTGALVWLVLITLVHVQLNIGWKRVESYFAGRQELNVGFLPVT